MNIEDDLRQALRREPAPAGFADRVLAITNPPAPKPWWALRGFVFANAVVAVVVLVIGGLGWRRHVSEEREQALEARRELLTALSVTKNSLQKVQERVRRVSARPVI